MSWYDRLKEVKFDEYCKTCKHKDAAEEDDPCFECLMEFANTESHKPVKWEEANPARKEMQVFIFMPLDKAIEHGKEKRKPYRGTKAFDCSCRNHGTCEYCHGNRLYSSNKRNESSKQQLKEWDDEK